MAFADDNVVQFALLLEHIGQSVVHHAASDGTETAFTALAEDLGQGEQQFRNESGEVGRATFRWLTSALSTCVVGDTVTWDGAVYSVMSVAARDGVTVIDAQQYERNEIVGEGYRRRRR